MAVAISRTPYFTTRYLLYPPTPHPQGGRLLLRRAASRVPHLRATVRRRGRDASPDPNPDPSLNPNPNRTELEPPTPTPTPKH